MPVLLFNTILLKAENASCSSLYPTYSGNTVNIQILNQFEEHEESLFSRFYIFRYLSTSTMKASEGKKKRKHVKKMT